jgi:hypothetical protein
MKKNIILGLFWLSLVPSIVFAQVPTPPINNVQGLISLECAVFDWIFYGLIALSLIMIVVAGFNYVTAGDNSEKVSKANKMILYAAIGIGVALLARGIPLIVGSFLGVGNTTGLTAC